MTVRQEGADVVRSAGPFGVTVVAPDAPGAAERLAKAVTDDARSSAHTAARERLSRGQVRGFFVVVAVVAVVGVWRPLPVLIVGILVATMAYLAILAYRVYLVGLSSRVTAMVVVSDEEARAVPDEELPVYTVMVPAFHEPEVVVQLVGALGRLDYPRDRLDVKLMLEEGDEETIAAALGSEPNFALEVVIVPDRQPKTKPKALNYGLTDARGELVTIYDAEDHPESLQLRKAAVAMRRLPDDIACLQARLVYHNPYQNLLTRWFSAEYLMWFSSFLPGLDALDAPLPLGGTSNHFRREAIEGAGGWDPFNVTEDADLGLRLHRGGKRVQVLDSITWEEANSDVVNWVKQRSRWYKGYLQTWLVHTRHPVRLVRDVGPRGVLGMCLFVLGTPLLAALNPVFWSLTLLWVLAQPGIIQQLFPGPVLYLGAISFTIGSMAVVYMGLVSARTENPRLVLAVLISPLYWVLMSVAAGKAFWQLFFRPSHWEKTTHGLSESPDAALDAEMRKAPAR